MEQRTLGTHGPRVGALGLGCMGMSDFYGPADRGESIATIHAALDAGMNLVDTGDYYGMGHNELLIGEALRSRRPGEAVVSVKFGALRDRRKAWLGYDDLAAIERAVPKGAAAGERYPAPLLVHLDSEKRSR